MTSLQKHLYTRDTKKLETKMQAIFTAVLSAIASIDQLHLPPVTAKNLQQFYDELGQPFFNSLTKKQIFKLAKLQLDIWDLHQKFKRLLILKSQKIGISSICILITLYHALTDCMGMELIINAQNDEQAKTHAQDLRRILMGSDKYRDYLITSEYTSLGLLKDEITKVHTIYLHNPKNPRLPTKIIVVGMSAGALLSHKRVGFIWSSDMTISQQTPSKMGEVMAAMMSRLANSQGPCIIECPARAPAGPVYDIFEQYETAIKEKTKLSKKLDFHVFKFTFELGLRDGFFDKAFIESEMRRLGPLFGTFYAADFFASGNTWYKREMLENETDLATDIFFSFHNTDDDISNVSEL